MMIERNKQLNVHKMFLHLSLLLVSFIIAFPFLWMLTNSIKTKEEIWQIPPKILPNVAQWQNYSEIFVDGMFLRYMWNSSYTALIVTVIILVNSMMFAYTLTNIRMKGKKVLLLLIMITYIMPATTTYVPSYVIISKLGLINTHAGYIFSSCASIFNIFFFRTVFLQINPGILEAARIDGAGHWKILWKIVAPMSSSSFVTLGLLSFLGGYNSYLWPSLLLRDKTKFLISMGLQSFFTGEGAYGLKWGTIMAACCFTVFPLLILFLIGERWISNGITNDAAVKE
jgi:multiple sugar transport system permease protein